MSLDYKKREVCALCLSNDIKKVINFGKTPLANSYLIKENEKSEIYPLTLSLCRNCGHLQLNEIVNPQKMFSNYFYVSGTSKVLINHFKDYASKIIDKFKLNKKDKILDIACNDGTFLQQFINKGYTNVIGVEPAKNLRKINKKIGIDINTTFFDFPTSKKLKKKYNNIKIITANNVCAHIPSINNFVKGISRHVSTGNMSHNTSAEMDVTANTKMGIASADINLAATNLSVFGSTGTIGGESIVYYGNTAHIPRVNSTSMHATTFHGTLEGNAKTATQAPTGSAGTHTVDTAANSTTAQPTAANVSEYLTKYAVKRVEIDPSDVLLGFINLSVKQGGVSNKKLDEKEVRLRMEGHDANKAFTAYQVAKGTLNPEFTNTTPTNTGRIRNAKKVVGTGNRPINITHLESTAKRLLIENGPMLNFAMPPELRLQLAGGITSATILTKDIRIGRFLSTEGFKTTLPQITSAAVDTQQLARNLSVSANILQAFNDNTSDFQGFELVVSDGVYVAFRDEEIVPDGPLDKRKSGKRIGFEVRGDGVMDLEASYEAATWINQTLPFEKLTLAYDRFGPKLHARIIVETNDIPENYVADFAKKVETTYNNKVQATNEFIEIKGEPEEYPELI